MKKPRALVLTGYGINCDYETEFAFNMDSVGADARRVHINDLIDGRDSLDAYHILAFPGGFSFGDDIAAGKVLALKFEYGLGPQLEKFIHDGKLVIGICNGFQAMVKMKILPRLDAGSPAKVPEVLRTGVPEVRRAGVQEARRSGSQQAVTLTFNDSGRFEDRWVHLKVNPQSPCVFTRGIETLYLPVRHGEGKFVPASEEIARRLSSNNQVVVRYCDASGRTECPYPFNPNGSVDSIAGICDPSGRIFGLMPHPEGYLFRTQHPRWTREDLPHEGKGVPVFRNAVEFARKELL
jgi:phosphoribosylformylglycinamidine synthase